jgi:hypothetical protein
MRWVTDGSFTFDPAGSAPSVTICLTSWAINGEPFAEFKKVSTCTPKDSNGNPSPEYANLPDNPVITLRGYFDSKAVSGYVDPPFLPTGTIGTFTANFGNTYTGTATVRTWADEAAEAAEMGFGFTLVCNDYAEA